MKTLVKILPVVSEETLFKVVSDFAYKPRGVVIVDHRVIILTKFEEVNDRLLHTKFG